MTVVVAVKSGDYLQPRGRQIEFEPGIIMAGDTRLSYIGGRYRPPEDDQVKVDRIGDFAIAGFAGNRDIATPVLSRLEETINKAGDFSPVSIASVTKRMLIEEDARYSRSADSNRKRVGILLGIRDPKTKMFVLYKMTTDGGFEPQPRDGMAAIGSHGHRVKALFDDIRRSSVTLPSDPFKGPQATLKENMAQFVWLLLDIAIETAGEEEKVEKKHSLIGGRPHLLVLHSGGVEAMDPVANSNLRL